MPTLDDQLQSMRELPENWDGYGAAAPLAGVVDFAQAFVAFLEAALKTSRSEVPAVHVSPTRVGGILIEWDDVQVGHEVDVRPDLSLSFLHLHRSTGQIITRSFAPDASMAVDPGLLQELRQLLAA